MAKITKNLQIETVMEDFAKMFLEQTNELPEQEGISNYEFVVNNSGDDMLIQFTNFLALQLTAVIFEDEEQQSVQRNLNEQMLLK